MSTIQRNRRHANRHLVVCGDSPLAYRLVEELVTRFGEEVTVILRSRESNHAPRIALLPRVKVVETAELSDAAFHRARLADARALALLDSDDAGNIHAALRAQEINNQLRLVLRVFNTSLGHRVRTLFTDCAVLSDAAMAAPSFVAAILGNDAPTHIRLPGKTLQVVRRGTVPAEQVVCGIADLRDPDCPQLLPADDTSADLVLAFAKGSQPDEQQSRARTMRSGFARVLRLVANRKLALAFIALMTVVGLGTVVFATFGGYTWWEAVYLTALDVAGAAQPDDALSAINKITQVTLTISSIAMIPIITAVVVDAKVSARLADSTRVVGPFADHVVVIGLGQVGTRVVAQLHDLGVPVVCIERNPEARGVSLAKRLGIPVVFGDASRDDTLRAAYVGSSRALVTMTSQDMVNLEAGLIARSIREDLRVVLRLFDGDFAKRVERQFQIPVSRSVSFLAAPAFAAAMVERQVIGTIPVGRQVLLIAEVPVGVDTELNGSPLRAVEEHCEVRVIALQRNAVGQLDWVPSADYELQPKDRLTILATRSGLGRILSSSFTAR